VARRKIVSAPGGFIGWVLRLRRRSTRHPMGGRSLGDAFGHPFIRGVEHLPERFGGIYWGPREGVVLACRCLARPARGRGQETMRRS
jgi:hypothetical protein